MNLQAAIITIGDELLIGQTIDTNSAWIAQQLNSIGIMVQRRIAVGDQKEAITYALDESLSVNDVVILTGGLGPTADDITKPLLAEYFGGSLIVDPKVLTHVTDMFSRRKRPVLERNMKQAEVPDCCTVLINKLGTAPGMWFERDGKIVISLPGVPFEMIGIMEEEAMPRLRQKATSDAIIHRSIITAGEGESFIAEAIRDLEEALPAHIKLAYLPHAGMVRLRLTGYGIDELRLIKEVEIHRDEIAGRLHAYVVSLDDIPIEQIVGKLLVGKGLMLALAESCTGGYIAHRFTEIMGSAGFFSGSIVCYQEAVKKKLLGVKKKTIASHNIVSEEVAAEMAQGARKVMGSDIGFGITGLLSGANDNEVSVGTVCMAVAAANCIKTKTLRFHSDRIRNKELAVTNALLFIWKFIQEKL